MEETTRRHDETRPEAKRVWDAIAVDDVQMKYSVAQAWDSDRRSAMIDAPGGSVVTIFIPGCAEHEPLSMCTTSIDPHTIKYDWANHIGSGYAQR